MTTITESLIASEFDRLLSHCIARCSAESNLHLDQPRMRLLAATLKINRCLTTTAGRATVWGAGAGLVEISSKLFCHPSTTVGELRETILHELAHIAAGKGHGHDPYWKALAKHFGSTGEVYHQMTALADTRKPKRVFEISCTQCGRSAGVMARVKAPTAWAKRRISTCCRADLQVITVPVAPGWETTDVAQAQD